MTYNKSKSKKRKHKIKQPYSSISYTTGDVALNIDHFNRMMGTAGDNAECASTGTALAEAKRYVRRYYMRPQNIFCSNKAEIIKALIDIGNQNSSIYTLNNLGDEKDVSKLMNSDIIYYYDDGILYDKNRVKVMDYDLSIKKEENRKHFADVDKTPEKEFKNEYEDRMTDATELEEAIHDNKLAFSIDELRIALEKASFDNSVIELGETAPMDENACTYSWEISLDGDKICVTGWGYNIYTDVDGIEETEYFNTIEDAYNYLKAISEADPTATLSLHSNTNEAFNLDFIDVDAYGERLTEAREDFCCVCGEPLDGYGNNPEPFMSSEEGRCCDGCNLKFVIPARLEIMKEN